MEKPLPEPEAESDAPLSEAAEASSSAPDPVGPASVEPPLASTSTEADATPAESPLASVEARPVEPLAPSDAQDGLSEPSVEPLAVESAAPEPLAADPVAYAAAPAVYTQPVPSYPEPPPPASSAAPGAGRPGWVAPLLGVLFGLFILGGLYFGYLFYQTVRDVTAYYNLPEPVVIPTRPAPVGAAQASAPTATPPPPPTVAPQSPASAPVWNRKGRVNILLMGTDDGRTCDSGVPRTDTIILVSLDTEAKKAYMVSIPRDLWVEIPGRGIAGIPTEQRINTAYTFGEISRFPGGGVRLVRDTIEKNFGQPVHYYAMVNFDGLKEIVDLVGGVDIEVKERLYDSEYPTDDCGVRTIDFKPGTHHMDGENALAYARSRHTTSDFDRSARQQQVLLALRRRALQPDVLPKLPALISQIRGLVKTDMSLLEMLALANVAKDIDPANIERHAIDVDMIYPWVRPDGAQVLLPDRAKIRVLFDQIFKSRPASSN